ncbi:MAG TPA: hypothetical protein VIZ69_01085 [Thermoanaerobaculia bacterium]
MARRTRFSFAILAGSLFLLAAAAPALPEKAAPAAPKPDSPAAAILARIAGLAGDWAGTAEWSGARTGSYALKARYYATGYGSAVVEDLISPEGVPSMSSVYHLDGADLRMTHYCGTRNQPRLKASKIDVAGGAVDFAFVDATNLASQDAPHVTGLELRFGDEDHFTMTFLFEGGGKASRERISLQRARPKA